MGTDDVIDALVALRIPWELFVGLHAMIALPSNPTGNRELDRRLRM